MDRIGRYDFVVSAHPTRGGYLSSRGNPGFVHSDNRMLLHSRLLQGNSMFNTLGNFAVNSCWTGFSGFCSQPHLTTDWSNHIQWNLDDPIHSTGGTHRYWDFEIKEWLETDLKPLHWEFFDYSLTILKAIIKIWVNVQNKTV